MKALKRIGFIAAIIIIVLIFIIIIILSISPAQNTQGKWDEKQREIEGLRDIYAVNGKESGADYGNDESRGILFTGEDEPLDKKEEPVKRMKVYFGFLRLRVDNVTETRSSISTLADEMGGYVESSYENTIIIRVPREVLFPDQAAFEELGDVVTTYIKGCTIR